MAVDPKREAFIRALLFDTEVARRCGIVLDDISADHVRLRMPFAPHLVTVGSVVHGGVIATLIDIAGATASASAAREDARGGATSTLTVSYLAPADGMDLEAEGVVIQRGRSQTVTEVNVRGPDGTLVAKALVTSRTF